MAAEELQVLLVDDDSNESRSVESMLEKLPAVSQLHVADRLSSALELLDARSFHVAIVALSLPDGRGLKAVRRIKEIRPGLPVVVMADSGGEELTAQALGLGARDYFVKGSVDPDLLGRSIHYAVESQRLQDALSDAQSRNRALLDASPDTIFCFRSDGACLHAKLSGEFPCPAPEDKLLGLAISDIVPPHLAEECGRYLDQALASEQIQNFEFQLLHDDTSNHFTMRFVPSAPDEVLAIVRNVTKSKQMEEKLKLSHRLEAVGRLAGGIAHDFNNILTVISGNAELSLMSADGNDENRSSLEEIRDAADRAANLIRQLLAFSRKQVLKPVVLDLNAMVERTETMLGRLIGEDIELVSQLQQGLDMIQADPAQIEQILMNLAVNARDAMPQGGTLVFQTEDVDVYETFVGQRMEIRSGPYVMLAVSDTGVGMDAETRAKIFEPFFTTKARGKGTGLGLSTVYGIVKQSGGYIWVYSEPGMGTTFKIYFPRAPAGATVPLLRDAGPVDHGFGETILLVEDDKKVLEVAQRFLDDSGYKVIAAPGISEALDIVSSHPGRIDLLATDVIMPGMSGAELASQLQPVRPDMRILYMSGYTDDAIAHHGVLAPGVAFLEKPYDRPKLLSAVRHALSSDPL